MSSPCGVFMAILATITSVDTCIVSVNSTRLCLVVVVVVGGGAEESVTGGKMFARVLKKQPSRHDLENIVKKKYADWASVYPSQLTASAVSRSLPPEQQIGSSSMTPLRPGLVPSLSQV